MPPVNAPRSRPDSRRIALRVPRVPSRWRGRGIGCARGIEMRRDIAERLRAGERFLLDDATGSELQRRKVDLSHGITEEGELGAWSATAAPRRRTTLPRCADCCEAAGSCRYADGSVKRMRPVARVPATSMRSIAWSASASHAGATSPALPARDVWRKMPDPKCATPLPSDLHLYSGFWRVRIRRQQTASSSSLRPRQTQMKTEDCVNRGTHLRDPHEFMRTELRG